MTEWDTPKGWIVALPHGQPDSVALGRVVDADGGQDEAENSYYEAVADPDFVRLETQRRRFRGQYLRRLGHIAARKRSRADCGSADALICEQRLALHVARPSW